MKKLIIVSGAYLSAAAVVAFGNLSIGAVFTLGVGVAAFAGCFIFKEKKC